MPIKLFSADPSVEGKVIYLLAMVVVVQFIYPITASESPASLMLYQLLYATLLATAILLARDSRRHVVGMTGLACLFLASNFVYAFNPREQWALFLGYASILPFQASVIQVLLRYVFATPRVTRDVLYAASAAYLMLGGLFVPLYGLVETLAPGSFLDNLAPDALMSWQKFIYFSYITLTTAGYGDILPVTLWARSLATMEAVIGVLYLTIIMARLVSLYSQGSDEGRPAPREADPPASRPPR